MRFNAILYRLENNIVNNTPDSANEKLYQKHFTMHETLVKDKGHRFKEDTILKAEKNYGCFALIANGIKDPVEVLCIYCLKGLIGKSFGNLKERL